MWCPPSDPKPMCRPASCTLSARSDTPPADTGRRSPRTFGPSTPPRPLTPQAERFEEFEEAVGGKYPAVMTRGGSWDEFVPLLSFLSEVRSIGLHDQRHRVAQRTVPEGNEDPVTHIRSNSTRSDGPGHRWEMLGPAALWPVHETGGRRRRAHRERWSTIWSTRLRPFPG